MTAVTNTVDFHSPDEVVRARPAGFLQDLTSIAGRALRAVPRDVMVVIPPIFIALFFSPGGNGLSSSR